MSDVEFFNEPLQLTKRQVQLTALEYAPLPRRVISAWEAVNAFQCGDEVVCDCEVFKNYFLAGFLHLKSGTYFYIEGTPFQEINCFLLHLIMRRFLVFTFNGNKYDIPIIRKAIKGASLEEIKELSDKLIHEEGYRDERAIDTFNHIDIFSVAPLSNAGPYGRTSLKVYAGRLHAPRIQELPIDPNVEVTYELSLKIIEYNFNDLDCTFLLLTELRPNIQLRIDISKKYGNDFRSLSDAQIAERIASLEIKKLTGSFPKKPGAGSFDGQRFFYKPPSYIQFQTADLQNMLAKISKAEVEIIAGYADCPLLKELSLTIGGKQFKMGLGGLHSQETSVSLTTSDDLKILDRDVTGYYPNMIIKNKFCSAHLGEIELEFLQNVVKERTAAKKAGDDTTASCLKITSNGWFGKKSDQYSIAYDPTQMVQTTLTGQLSLIMLIEQLTLSDFKIVSANTDGVVTLCPTARLNEFRHILTVWEQITGLDTEETEYAGYYARDVNNYFAVKLDGNVKAKGAYAEKGSALNSVLSKNPFALICSDAVKARLSKGTPIEDTILGCRDVRRFVCLQSVRGGAHKAGVYLGRVVRWYYAKGEKGAIQRVTNGNQVPRSTGAKPLMELPAAVTIDTNPYTDKKVGRESSLPPDLDFGWYVKAAYEILEEIGFASNKSKQIDFFG